MSDGDMDWEEGFYILRKSLCPVVLTENFFMDPRSDLEYLQSRAGKQAVVSEESMNVDEKSSSFLLEDGFVLCTEALMRHDYAVFDPLTRSIHRSRWYLQNKFIPMMADCVSNGYLPHLALESGPGWWDYIERDYDMRLNLERGFYCNKLEMKEGYVIYFYNFAEPKVLSDALYCAAVVNKATSSVQYYKLELNFDNEWFLCEQTQVRHRILGTSKSSDRGNFVN